jgi:uncharacterized membrane protein YhaH (DUF805 family)
MHVLAQIEESTSDGLSAGALAAIIVVAAILLVLHIAGFWKTLEKGGEPGAFSLLFLISCLYPIAYLPMARLTGRPGWWVVLLYIPLVNLVVLAILSIDIARSYGKGTGFGIGLWLLPFVFYPMLGFGDARYQGRSVTA